MNSTRPPRYDLDAAQRADVEISTTCVRKANETLILDREQAARRYVRDLFLSLVPGDFAHVEVMRPKAGRVIQGDVYGKVDSHGLWFIKFQLDVRTVIMSCHEAEHDLKLADGRTLWRRR